eukprot:jgi/Chrzof1/1114/Cz01g40180.t1
MWLAIVIYDPKGDASLSVSPEAPAVLPTSLARTNSLAVKLPVTDSSRNRSTADLHGERRCAVMGRVMGWVMEWVLKPIAMMACVPVFVAVFCCAVISECDGGGGGVGVVGVVVIVVVVVVVVAVVMVVVVNNER